MAEIINNNNGDNYIVIVLYNQTPLNYIYNNKYIFIIVDNTPNRDLKLSQNNIIYIPNKKNIGIASALNIGMRIAIEKGAKWVLTMDQDSDFKEDMIINYNNFIKENKDKTIGLLSPILKLYDGDEKENTQGFKYIQSALTSGSFVNVNAYNVLGGFKDEYFIDYVDIEYCWNLISNGYNICQLNNVIMQHHLGNTKEYRLFGKHLFYVTNHNYIRYYYMTRNRLYTEALYPDFARKCRTSKLHNIWSILRILLFEDDFIRKFKAIQRGKLDFRKKIMGEYCLKG